MLRVEHYELRHTNTLAWLLDPIASHGMGHAFLDRFLQQILGTDAPLGSPLVEVRTELVLRAGDALVEDDDRPDEDVVSTKDRLDILVEGRARDGRPWAVAIEAKIDSQEGNAQLQRYDRALRRLLRQVEPMKCYLTLGTSETVSSPHWQQISWGEQVGNVLRETLAACADLDERVRDFLTDYRDLIQALSGQEDGGTNQVAALANRPDVAPALRVLNQRIKQKRVVHSWDAEPWAATYRRHKTALDACRHVVREKGAILVSDVITRLLAGTPGWERISEPSSKALRGRFVPRSWVDVDGIKTKDGQWNLFYQAEFRDSEDNSDIEIKLYVAPPGDPIMQKALMQRLFGTELALRPADSLRPRSDKLKNFVLGSGDSVKLYTQSIDWHEREDGTLSVDDQFDDAMQKFELAVVRHTKALRGLGGAAAAA